MQSMSDAIKGLTVDNEEIREHLYLIQCIGYVISSISDSFTVVLPEKPFGKLKAKFPQKEKKVDALCYDKYELKGFEVVTDDNDNIIDWRFINVNKLVRVQYLVALLADKRIVADDGECYKVWDHKAIQSEEWVSQFDWALSSGNFNSVRNIRLLIRNNVIYGTESCEDYKFRNSWEIEDTLAKYLNGYDRYTVRNNAEKLY